MNYGSEVFIDQDHIRLTDTLLAPLSAARGTPFYGLYYPPREDGLLAYARNYPQVLVQHDLMFTPVPHVFWPRAVAGRIDIKNQNGILKDVFATLRDEGLNIILFRCSRATHRYATAHFVAALENYDADGLHTEVEIERRRSLLDQSEKLGDLEEVSEIKSYSDLFRGECAITKLRLAYRLSDESLFSSLRSPGDLLSAAQNLRPGDLGNERWMEVCAEARKRECVQWTEAFNREPFDFWALSYLAYFSMISRNKNSKPRTHIFTAQAIDKHTLQIVDRQALAIRTDINQELPTIGLASLDTEAYLIRIAVLSQRHLSRFREVDIEYQYRFPTEGTGSAVGVFTDFMQAIAAEWNIWNVYNLSKRWDRDFELGELRLVMEFHCAHRIMSPPPAEDLEATLRSAVQRKGFAITSVTVKNFTSRRIFVSIKGGEQFDRSDEILTLCKDVGEEFGYLRSNIRTVDDYITNSVSASVSSAIQESSGLIQFLMADETGGSFTWVESEFFYATMLNLPTVRIVDRRLKDEIRFYQDKAVMILPEFSSSERLRGIIRRAFSELNERIRFI